MIFLKHASLRRLPNVIRLLHKWGTRAHQVTVSDSWWNGTMRELSATFTQCKYGRTDRSGRKGFHGRPKRKCQRNSTGICGSARPPTVTTLINSYHAAGAGGGIMVPARSETSAVT